MAPSSLFGFKKVTPQFLPQFTFNLSFGFLYITLVDHIACLLVLNELSWPYEMVICNTAKANPKASLWLLLFPRVWNLTVSWNSMGKPMRWLLYRDSSYSGACSYTSPNLLMNLPTWCPSPISWKNLGKLRHNLLEWLFYFFHPSL